MEYLQFGFAAAFCVLLYTDQRSTIRAMTKSFDRLALSVEKMLKHRDEPKAD